MRLRSSGSRRLMSRTCTLTRLGLDGLDRVSEGAATWLQPRLVKSYTRCNKVHAFSPSSHSSSLEPTINSQQTFKNECFTVVYKEMTRVSASKASYFLAWSQLNACVFVKKNDINTQAWSTKNTPSSYSTRKGQFRSDKVTK